MTHRQGRPADPRRRAREDPPAHLPRGQLLRRPRAGHARRAGDRGRRHDPDQPDLRAGPVRPAADLAAVRHARGPQDAARRVRQRARQGRRRGLQPLDPVLEERLPRHRDRQRGLARRDRARPLRLRQERRRDRRGAGPQPRAAQEPDHRLQHDGRRVRPRAGQPAHARSPSCRARCAPPSPRSPRSTPRSRRCARSPPTCARACAPPRPRSTPRSRSSASCAGWSPRTSCAAWPPTCARRSRRSPALARESIPLAEQNRLLASCQNEVVLPWSQGQGRGQAVPGRGPGLQRGAEGVPRPRRREPLR